MFDTKTVWLLPGVIGPIIFVPLFAKKAVIAPLAGLLVRVT
nr:MULTISPECIES: hypothetical protein [Bacillus cereus group]